MARETRRTRRGVLSRIRAGAPALCGCSNLLLNVWTKYSLELRRLCPARRQCANHGYSLRIIIIIIISVHYDIANGNFVVLLYHKIEWYFRQSTTKVPHNFVVLFIPEWYFCGTLPKVPKKYHIILWYFCGTFNKLNEAGACRSLGVNNNNNIICTFYFVHILIRIIYFSH